MRHCRSVFMWLRVFYCRKAASSKSVQAQIYFASKFFNYSFFPFLKEFGWFEFWAKAREKKKKKKWSRSSDVIRGGSSSTNCGRDWSAPLDRSACSDVQERIGRVRLPNPEVQGGTAMTRGSARSLALTAYMPAHHSDLNLSSSFYGKFAAVEFLGTHRRTERTNIWGL